MTKLIAIEDSTLKLKRCFTCIFIPGLAVLIPNLSGLISNHKYQGWQLFLSYSYFVLTALIIWKGNFIFFRNLRKRYEQEKKGYFTMLGSRFLLALFFSGILSIILFLLWEICSNEPAINWSALIYTTGITVLSVLVINNFYEFVLLRKEMDDNVVKYRMLEIAKMQAELEALKAQIDPHFIFNSLNTLSYLITHDPQTARIYNETLARVYRYILYHKEQDLVFLKDEMEFIRDYLHLVSIRFNEAVKVDIAITATLAENHLITPIALQMLIENAIKHNYFTHTHPLLICISVRDGFVTVKNRIRKKEYHSRSSGIGLKNLQERYLLILKKEIFVYREQDDFIVKVPIIKA